jgi:hypothetical protein
MRKALALKCLTGLHFGRKLKSQSKPKKRNAPLLFIPWLIHSYTREGFYLTCRSLKTSRKSKESSNVNRGNQDTQGDIAKEGSAKTLKAW